MIPRLFWIKIKSAYFGNIKNLIIINAKKQNLLVYLIYLIFILRSH